MTDGALARFTFGEIEGRPLLEISGEIDLSNSAELARALDQLRPASVVVIDMSALRFMDSSGINALARYRKSVRASDGTVYLIVVHPVLRKIFAITGLDRHFRLIGSRQDLPSIPDR